MTKEEYIIIRGEEEIPLSLFYEYYKEKREEGQFAYCSLEEFEVAFPQFMALFGNQRIISKTGFLDVSFEKIVEKVYKYFNEKFEL